MSWCNAVLNDKRSLTVVVKLIVMANTERLCAGTKIVDIQNSDARDLDILCLSLALLTNMVHEEARMKSLLMSTSA